MRKAIAAFLGLLAAAGGFARTIHLDILPGQQELSPGLSTQVWSYNGQVPGTPILTFPGEHLVIEGTNRLPVATNIHWHGLVVPNDQDGPMVTIAPGAAFRYEFTVRQSGTFWYHSHFRPVVDQVDMGLYGAIISAAPEDKSYSGDHVFVLDDWAVNGQGQRLPGTGIGHMERQGNIETVNGKTAEAIEPLVFRHGELHKLRIINASTAAIHTLRISGHQFRVTHTDGNPVGKPWLTDTLVLYPAERIDAEVEALGQPGGLYSIDSDRPEGGLMIPVNYAAGLVKPVASPFVPPAPRAFAGLAARPADFTLVLDSRMSGGMGRMGKGGMMSWTINGKAFPETVPLKIKLGQIVKVRFVNNDTKNMHPMNHPIHLHGTSFQVLSVGGQAPDGELWKDTVAVPAGSFVDVAFRYSEPGMWMLHCHILDHEDNGMMTDIEVE